MRSMTVLLSTASAVALTIGFGLTAAYSAIKPTAAFTVSETDQVEVSAAQVDILLTAFRAVDAADEGELTLPPLEDHQRIFSLLVNELPALRLGSEKSARLGSRLTEIAFATNTEVTLQMSDAMPVTVFGYAEEPTMSDVPGATNALLAQICVGRNCPPPRTTGAVRDPGPPATTGAINGYG